jgi:hypothetical protein
MGHARDLMKRRNDDRSEGAGMEPIWVLLRCYRTTPGAACNILGVYYSAGAAIADAEDRQKIAADAWKPSNQYDEWCVEDQVYAYKLESFRVPAAPPPPIDSLEVETVH